MLTGSVLIDLRDVEPDFAYRRLATLYNAPDGARVVLVVGALAPNPRVVDLLVREHVDRLHVEVQGEAWQVPKWLAALSTGDVLAGYAP